MNKKLIDENDGGRVDQLHTRFFFLTLYSWLPRGWQ
jgi:hypothetical protein